MLLDNMTESNLREKPRHAKFPSDGDIHTYACLYNTAISLDVTYAIGTLTDLIYLAAIVGDWRPSIPTASPTSYPARLSSKLLPNIA